LVEVLGLLPSFLPHSPDVKCGQLLAIILTPIQEDGAMRMLGLVLMAVGAVMGVAMHLIISSLGEMTTQGEPSATVGPIPVIWGAVFLIGLFVFILGCLRKPKKKDNE